MDTLSAKSLINAAITPGSAADTAEERKCARYSSLADRYLFQPVAIETTGTMGSSTRAFIDSLRKRISDFRGLLAPRTTLYCRSPLKLCLHHGNRVHFYIAPCAIPYAGSTFLLHSLFFSLILFTFSFPYIIISFLYLSGVRHRWPQGRGGHPPTLIPRDLFT